MTCSLFFIHLALHLAVMQGRLNNVRALLTESNIDAEAYNLRSGLKHLKSHSHYFHSYTNPGMSYTLIYHYFE